MGYRYTFLSLKISERAWRGNFGVGQGTEKGQTIVFVFHGFTPFYNVKLVYHSLIKFSFQFMHYNRQIMNQKFF